MSVVPLDVGPGHRSKRRSPKKCKDTLCNAKVHASKNSKYPKSGKFNKTTNHAETTQEESLAKIGNVANVTPLRQMVANKINFAIFED